MNHWPKFAAEIMTSEVVTLEENDNLTFLDESMHALRFRHLPVVDGKRLIGLVTQRDVMRVSASSLLPASRQQTALLTRKFLVRDVMARNVQTVRPDTPLAEVAKLLWQKKVGCLPVVEGENTLVGIITEADFVRLFAQFFQKMVT